MSKQSNNNKLLHIATIGKTVGIKGDMKLHIKCDFPEQFVKGATFLLNKKECIALSDVDLERGLVRINNITNPEDAKKFTNAKLFTTYEETRKNCHLEKGEYFWFDLQDCKVFEDAQLLGVVKEIERFNSTNYLSIQTDEALIQKGLPKSFLVPFIEPFKVAVDIKNKRISLQGAMDILEAS